MVWSHDSMSITAPKEQMKEDKHEQKEEIRNLSVKIDQLLAGQANRRGNDG